MPSVFSRIIAGELPAYFVWKDDQAVAFLSINPLRPGHTLVVPRWEIDHWLDLPPELLQHLTHASQQIGAALQRGFRAAKVGMMIAGLEVPHTHIHLVPINTVHDMDFDRAEQHPAAGDLDEAARIIRRELRALGSPYVAD